MTGRKAKGRGAAAPARILGGDILGGDPPDGAGEHLRRGLSNRHIQLIAIGGAIGTGLFLGAGKSIDPRADPIAVDVIRADTAIAESQHDDGPTSTAPIADAALHGAQIPLARPPVDELATG